MEKQESAEFLQYMAKKLKVSSQKDLEAALTGMGPDKLKAAYQEFKNQSGGVEDSNYSSETSEYKDGGVLDYFKCLNLLKKGGVVNCGCGKKMEKGGAVPKAFLGSILSGAKAIFAGANTAGKLAQGASTAMKIGKGIQQAGNIINTGSQILGTAKSLMAPTTTAQTMPTAQVGINPQVPQAMNPVTAQNTPTLGKQSIPTFTPTGTQPGVTPGQPKPMYSEDGGKLKKLKDLKKSAKKK
jgi:hypothetical protein